MDAFKTPGAFSWCELATPDPAKATDFYGKLLGWTFDDMPMAHGDTYRVVKVGAEAVGGIMAPPPGGPPMACWSCYVTVTDADATARQCAELGGKAVVPPTDIPNVGRFAALQDPQGAVFCVIAYKMPG